MVTLNQLLLFGGVAVAGYLVWTNQGQIIAAVQQITNPPAAAAAPSSGSSSLNLTSPATGGCVSGAQDPTTGLCPDGSVPTPPPPAPFQVGTGVNNSAPQGIPPMGVTPTISGGADVGGAGVSADTGPTFTDPITGQTYNPGTGQILSPGGSTQIPNFSPFVEPQVGSANVGPPGGSLCPQGTRWSQCFQACQPAGILEPAPGDPRCIGGIGLHSGNCPDGSLPDVNGNCGTATTPPAPPVVTPTPTPAPLPAPIPGNTACIPQFCGPGGVWDYGLCRCVPAGLQTSAPDPSGQVVVPPPAPVPAPLPTAGTPTVPTTTPAPITQAPVVYIPPPITQAPPTPTTITTTTPPPAPAPAPVVAATGSLNCSKSGAGCCNSSHKGNCHSECGFGKSMTSSTCLSCLAVCGTYEGKCNCSTGQAAVGYAYSGRASRSSMDYASEGAMIAAAATAPLAKAVPHRFPTVKHGARVSSRSQKVTPANPIASAIFNRQYNFPNRVAVS